MKANRFKQVERDVRAVQKKVNKLFNKRQQIKLHVFFNEIDDIRQLIARIKVKYPFANLSEMEALLAKTEAQVWEQIRAFQEQQQQQQ